MTVNVSTENVYLSFIVLLLMLQIFQWYYIFNLKRQMQSVWSQIATMALMFYAKDAMRNEQQSTKDQE